MKITDKLLKEINSHTIYKNCTFHLEEIKFLEKSKFDNCSFRETLIINTIQNCSFNNCNFISMFIAEFESVHFENGYIHSLNILPVKKEIGQLDFLENVKVFQLNFSFRTNIFNENIRKKYAMCRFGEIVQISSKIGNLNSLIELNLNNNRLKNLPIEIKDLALTQIHLDRNKLEHFPKEIVQIASLNKVFMSNNGIENIPIEINIASYFSDAIFLIVYVA